MFEWAIYRLPKILTFSKWSKSLRLLQRTVFLVLIKITHSFLFLKMCSEPFMRCPENCPRGKLRPGQGQGLV